MLKLNYNFDFSKTYYFAFLFLLKSKLRFNLSIFILSNFQKNYFVEHKTSNFNAKRYLNKGNFT